MIGKAPGGRRVREKTSMVSNGVETAFTQDKHIAYNRAGQMSDLADDRYRAHYDYDANGGQARIFRAGALFSG